MRDPDPQAPPVQPAERLARWRARFAERRLPLTIQRRAVLEELARRADHPTAEDVFGALSPALPGLSRATVYRTLETLVELDLARRVAHLGAAARYDARTDHHHHLVCEGCGAVSDTEARALPVPPAPAEAPPGFVVRDWSVQFVGLCARCAGD